jgi:hypothetical protein
VRENLEEQVAALDVKPWNPWWYRVSDRVAVVTVGIAWVLTVLALWFAGTHLGPIVDWLDWLDPVQDWIYGGHEDWPYIVQWLLLIPAFAGSVAFTLALAGVFWAIGFAVVVPFKGTVAIVRKMTGVAKTRNQELRASRQDASAARDEYVSPSPEGETLPQDREASTTRRAEKEADEEAERAKQEARLAERAAYEAELVASAEELLRSDHTEPSDMTLGEAESRLSRLESMVAKLEYMSPRGFQLSRELDSLIGPYKSQVIRLAESATCACCEAQNIDPESRLRRDPRPDVVLCRECDGKAGVMYLDFTNGHSAHHLSCEIHGTRVLWERPS